VAPLEGSAVLMALEAFLPVSGGRDEAALLQRSAMVTRGSVLGVARGWTDNKGNPAIHSRAMTTKYPLLLVLIELSAQSELRGLELDLGWAPREVNCEADALSNGQAKGFDPALRVHVRPSKIPWVYMREMEAAAKEFAGDVARTKQVLKLVPRSEVAAKRRRAEDRLKFRDPW
jgi:hypothetical protein